MSERRRRKEKTVKTNILELSRIEPLTDNQAKAFELWERGNHLILHGVAGTGKTFLAFYLTLNELLSESCYKKVVIIRSTVSMRDMGFLKGGPEEKCAEFESIYHEICADLFDRGDAYQVLKMKGMIEFRPTAFLRGKTFNDCLVIVDEIANMTFQELDGVITRMGKNSRMILAGDYRQSDFRFRDERVGLASVLKILESVPGIDRVEFDYRDIVRSDFVRDYIISKTEFESDVSAQSANSYRNQ